MYVLNIGLQRNDGGTLNVRAVLASLVGRGIVYASHGVHTSDTERTLVLTCAPVPTSVLYALALALAQDCIAVYDTGAQAGRLIGPKAREWGTFNPQYFIRPDGERLA